MYFNIFPNFLAISETGGVPKSRPIDPFFDVIYLFLNVRFGQKPFKFTVYGCHDLRFGCFIWYFFAAKSTFFYSISLFFFDDLSFYFLNFFKLPSFLLPSLSNFHFWSPPKSGGGVNT